VEVEADSFAQAEQAIAAGADIILLDNMSPPNYAGGEAGHRSRRTEASAA